MICKKCGAETEDGARFCGICGQNFSETESMGGNKKKRWIAIGVCLAIVMIGVFLVTKTFGGRSYEKVVQIYIDSQFSGEKSNLKKWINVLPEEVVDSLIDEIDEDDVSNEQQLIDYLFDELYVGIADQFEREYGDGWSYSYEVIDTKDVSEEELEELIEYLEKYGFKREIKEAKSLEIKVEFKTKKGEMQDSETIYVDVIRIGRNWYMFRG